MTATIKYVRVGDKVYLITSDDEYLNRVGDNFEPNMVRAFRKFVDPNDVVVDIGANIGLTVYFFLL